MKTKYLLIILCFLFSAITVTASRHKHIKKSFPVFPNQKIDLNKIWGTDLEVRSWDKNEVLFDLDITFRSSDKKYEKEYIHSFDITKDIAGSSVVFNFKETNYEPGINFFGLFHVRFMFSVSSNVTGKIYLPRQNQLDARFKYSNVVLNGMKSAIYLDGTGNELSLIDCSNVYTINNKYGNTAIANCGGDLELESRNSEISIDGFKGSVKIKSDYSNVKISNVRGFVDLKNRSGEIEIINANGVTVEAPYSTIKIQNITGAANEDIDIINRNGNISLSEITGNVFVNDSYSSITLQSITGNVNLNSKSSSVFADSITGNWKSYTEYSQITIKKLAAEKVSIENKNGAVIVDLETTPHKLNIENFYGAVEVSLPKAFTGKISLVTKNGIIESDFPINLRTKNNSVRASGKISSGSSTITIETSHANIKLKSN